MRKVYIAVFITFLLSVTLFVGSLFYLDKEKHKVFYFTVTADGHDAESVKIDKYITEDKLIYKSQVSSPFNPLWTESRSRIALDSRYNLQSYSQEDSGPGLQDTVYLENTNENISYVATSRSEFACLTDLPIKKGTFVFEEFSPGTYLPILENYDFNIGRSQAFNVITQFTILLPPMKRLLTLTSIRDEYLKIGTRKIKVECLVIKIRNSPQGMLWVTKSGRSLVAIEFPDKKIRISRSFVPKTLEVKKFYFNSELYREDNVKFNNKKIVLSATITIPKKDSPRPAVLLIGGNKGYDREEGGLFTDIADNLGKKGFMVLRFDKRGSGSSSADSRSVTNKDELEDASSALDYLLSRKEVDPGMVSVIGHGKGALLAAKLSLERKEIKGLLFMAPLISSGGETDLNFDNLKEMAVKMKWSEQYLKIAIKSRMETVERVGKTKSNWISLLRTRCFLKKLREELEEKPTDIIRKIEVPVLILYGKEDEFIPPQAAATLDKALEESGNKNHKLVYYSYLGHFFGNFINDGLNKAHYEVDGSVLDTIAQWLYENVPAAPPVSP